MRNRLIPSHEPAGMTSTIARNRSRQPDRFTNPHPAETVVRMRVLGPFNRLRFGDDCLQYATESLILTVRISSSSKAATSRCRRNQFAADHDRPVDGKLKGTNPAQVHFWRSRGRGDRL
jgi:hypothetical protein